MNNNIDFLKKSLIAHRRMYNSKKGIPENSIAAFQKAIDNNLIIELDVHVLKDNTVVVFHDDNLGRMCSKNINIKELQIDDLKRFKLQNTQYQIPTLNEVLELVNGKVPLIIEFKYDVKHGRLEKNAMKLLKKYKGFYVVKSFSPLSVLWFKKHYPNVIRGLLSCNFTKDKMFILKKWCLKNMITNFFIKPDFISYDIHSFPNKKIEKYRKNHLVLGWTVKNNQDLQLAKKYCDNYICENFDNINHA